MTVSGTMALPSSMSTASPLTVPLAVRSFAPQVSQALSPSAAVMTISIPSFSSTYPLSVAVSVIV